jgi:AraC-like DNA-binding protein
MKNSFGQLQVGLTQSQGIAVYPAGATFGPRHMNDWEFVWILEGNAQYARRDENGEIVVAAPAGSVVLCRPNATDSFVWDAHQRTRHAFFHFRVHSLPDNWPHFSSWPLVHLPQNDDLLRPLFRHLLRGLRQTSSTETALNTTDDVRVSGLRLTVALLLTSFVEGDLHDGGEPPPETWPDGVERAWNFIHRRLGEAPDARISLPELAKAAHTTPEHLCRIFKSATGWTPIQALRLPRLDHAAVLLARSNYNIAEIAHLCGFASAFHFSRCFKDAFAQSPREMRRDLHLGKTPPVPRLLRQRF